VGFRPFVHRLAVEMGLPGWVSNGRGGVLVEVEGVRGELERFLERFTRETPVYSRIVDLDWCWLPPIGARRFEIRESDLATTWNGLGFVVPDLATCSECLSEIGDPGNRRHRYPFTNCTHCGPRYSIIENLPYDRERTSMRRFALCPACRAEYEDPRSRRFHAQPNACPECGPQLTFVRAGGDRVSAREEALQEAVKRLKEGEVVAVKGVGGYQLWVRAHDSKAIATLRERKQRPAKPFALMVGTVDAARELCEVSDLEEQVLRGPEAPIVLLRRCTELSGRSGSSVASGVAPGHPNLGVMLPCTPVQHLLLSELGCPVVATSGNLGEEPICWEDEDALARLGGIADGFLLHDRPIVRPVDDSIVRVMAGRPVVLRRARGYAPTVVNLNGVLGDEERGGNDHGSVLGVGAHQKNVVALSRGNEVIVGPHIGDLETALACESHRRAARDLEHLFSVRPNRVAEDGHPEYASSRYARETGWPRVRIQHHYAHVLSCLAEHGIRPPAVGMVWDGTGDGMDGTIWGGEFLKVTAKGWERVGSLRPFRLPGGEAAVREPRRSALGVMREGMESGAPFPGENPAVAAFSMREREVLMALMDRGIQSPWCTSMGRLFDAVASILGLCQVHRYEGDAAMALEFAAGELPGEPEYPFDWNLRSVSHESPGRLGRISELSYGDDAASRQGVRWFAREVSALECRATVRQLGDAPGRLEWDWRPMLRAIMMDQAAGVPVGTIAARFQDTLVSMAVSLARRVGEPVVVLTGGCFQNRRLTESTVKRLGAEGFRAVWHQRIPPNDGGIALGQVVAALREEG